MFCISEIYNPRYYMRTAAEIKPCISANYCVDERTYVADMAALWRRDNHNDKAVSTKSARLIRQVRIRGVRGDPVQALMHEYHLGSKEGLVLMALAESLLRIPDLASAEALIKEKFKNANWERHLHHGDELLVNTSTWGLILAGRLLQQEDDRLEVHSVFEKLLHRVGQPLVCQLLLKVMSILGGHFVIGSNMDDALSQRKLCARQGVDYSFDCLGEAALTRDESDVYFQAYLQAIRQLGQDRVGGDQSYNKASMSIKLSALSPRFEAVKSPMVIQELYPKLMCLIEEAITQDVAMTIDAEEMDRLELTLDLFERLISTVRVQGWGQLGLAVQAYSKRALPVLLWLSALAREHATTIPIRLVKGAYWDTEIKLSQQCGFADYPVFTQKSATDLSYLCCARFLLSSGGKSLYPQFATHNAHTVCAVLELAREYSRENDSFEFQHLYGMGECLYDTLLTQQNMQLRIYAPVGDYKKLLPYLVRRLMENGANNAFVQRLMNEQYMPEEISVSPVDELSQEEVTLPLPENLYAWFRKNSQGLNIAIESQWRPLEEAIMPFLSRQWYGGSFINGHWCLASTAIPCYQPSDQASMIGRKCIITDSELEEVFGAAQEGAVSWRETSVTQRADCLGRLAVLLESHRAELVALCHREGGKTLQDALDEVREAVDFCYYYASEGERLFMGPHSLPGATGEVNELGQQGRGVFVCISPWNFPLAIFLGQITAALMAGNAVIAKPSKHTALTACRAISLFLEAGFPEQVIQLVIGDAAVGHKLCRSEWIDGVAFTGSFETAQHINRTLAAREGAIVPLIAETGGQNAMIVDSTALLEQVVNDVIESAFRSAGQRCSALRVLFLQEDIADDVELMLAGAMAELTLGDPSLRSTDIGPVIDEAALQRLQAHIDEGQVIAQSPYPDQLQPGFWVAPCALAVSNMEELTEEYFGPVLHVIRYSYDELSQVIEQINRSGFGLTLSIHTRNIAVAEHIAHKVRVGNVYINRNQVGATVGTQPFGGMGKSGTGPKAGGPHYLLRFSTEQTITMNTAAMGGNAALLSGGQALDGGV